MRITRFAALVLVWAVLLLLETGFAQRTFSKHGLVWSTYPSLFANISKIDSWEQIAGSALSVQLDEKKDVLVNYHVVVEGLRSIGISPLPREDNKDTIQMRFTINNTPYRISSTYFSTYSTERQILTELSGTFAVSLPAGESNFTLQWRKSGSLIEKWVISSPSVGSGLVISAIADYKYLTYRHESNDVVLSASNTWQPLTEYLPFNLTEDSFVTIGYSFSAQPLILRFTKDRVMEYVTARLIIDSIPYSEGSESYGSGSWNPTPANLNGYITVKLQAGLHVAQVHWKKIGTTFKSWASNPSYLGGFASARNIFAIVSKFDTYTTEVHQQSFLSGDGIWRSVNNSFQTFNLIKESAVYIRYALPVSQFQNPNFDSFTWEQLSKIQVRVIVDNFPYQHVTEDNAARTIKNVHGSLGVVLAAGKHTISLQWRADAGVDWMVLNTQENGFSNGIELMTYITSNNSNPYINFPSHLSTYEDQELEISSISIGDIDENLGFGITVQFSMSVTNGTFSLPNIPIISNISLIDGARHVNVTVVDTIANINQMLSKIVFQPPENFFGKVNLFYFMSDNANIGSGGTLTSEGNTTIDVVSVDDHFTLDFIPEAFVREDDSNSQLIPLLLNDFDSQNSTFRVQLSSFCGQLSLGNKVGLTFLFGDGTDDLSLDFFGIYADLKHAIETLSYRTRSDCNSLQHDDIISVYLMNLDNRLQDSMYEIRVKIVDVNDGVDIATVSSPRWYISGILLQPSVDISQVEAKYIQLPEDTESTAVVTSINSPQLWSKSNVSAKSSLALLTANNVTYGLSLQYNDDIITPLSGKYIPRNVDGTFAIEVLMNKNISGEVFCSLGDKILNGSAQNGFVSCISGADTLSNVNDQDIVWLKISTTDDSFSSNYLPYLVYPQPVLVSSNNICVAPVASRIKLRVQYAASLSKCVVDNSTHDLVFDGEYVYCSITELNSGKSVSLSLSSTKGEYRTEPISIFIMDFPSITSYELTKAGSLVNVIGTWSQNCIQNIEPICFINNVPTSSIYHNSSNVFCDVSSVQLNDLSLSIAWDQYVTDVINITVPTDVNLPMLRINDWKRSFDKLIIGITSVNIPLDASFSCNFGDSTIDATSVSTNTFECKLPDQSVKYMSFQSSKYNISSNSISISQSRNSKVYSILPARGSIYASTEVTVIGSGFSFDSAITCKFGQVPTAALYVSDSEIRCVTPSHRVGSVVVTILMDGIEAEQSTPLQFTYTPTPVIRSVSPHGGPLTGGTELTVTGEGFDEKSSSARCYFGESSWSPATVKSSTELSCVSPRVSSSGYYTLSVRASDFQFSGSLSIYFANTPTLHKGQVGRTAFGGIGTFALFGANFDAVLSYSCQLSNLCLCVVSPVTANALEVTIGACNIYGTTEIVVSADLVGSIGTATVEVISAPTLVDVHIAPNEMSDESYLILDVESYNNSFAYCLISSNYAIAFRIKDSKYVCLVDNILLLGGTDVKFVDYSHSLVSNSIETVNFKTEYIEVFSDLNIKEQNIIQSAVHQLYGGVNQLCTVSRSGAINGFDSADCATYSNETYLKHLVSDKYSSRQWLSNFIPYAATIPSITSSYLPLESLGEARVDMLVANLDYVSGNCKINGYLDCSWESSYNSTDYETSLIQRTRKTTNNTYHTDLIIDTIEPRLVDTLNDTWITVNGKGFTNATSCYLNNQTMSPFTFFISSKSIQCYIPIETALQSSFVVNVAVIDEWTSEVSVNSESIYFNVFNSDFSNQTLQSDYHSNFATNFSSNVETPYICLADNGCNISEVRSVCDLKSNYVWMNYMANSLVESSWFDSPMDTSICGASNFSFLQRYVTSNNYSAPSVTAAEEKSRVEIFFSSTKSFSVNSTMNHIYFYGNNFVHSDNWCITVEKNQYSCVVETSSRLVCIIDTNQTIGNHSFSLMWKCEEDVYTGFLSFNLMQHIPTMDFGFATKPVVSFMEPRSGPLIGNSTLRLFGKNLQDADAVKFKHSVSQKEYIVHDVDIASTEIVLRTPLVAEEGQYFVSISFNKSHWVTLKYSFQFYQPPVAEYSVNRLLTENDIIIVGELFPVMSQVFCSIKALNSPASIVPGIVLSSSRVKCPFILPVSMNTVIERVDISFNGYDFVEVEKIYTENIQKGALVVGSALDLESEFPKVEEATVAMAQGLVKSTICTGDSEVVIPLRYYSQTNNYSCVFDGVVTQAIVRNEIEAICVIPPRSPGSYKLQIVPAYNENDVILENKMTIECQARPTVFSTSLLPLSFHDGIHEIQVLGQNFDKFSVVYCILDGVETRAAIDSSHHMRCVFSSIAPGKHEFSVVISNFMAYKVTTCLTESNLMEGVSLIQNDICSVDAEAVIEQILPSTSRFNLSINSLRPNFALSHRRSSIEISADKFDFTKSYSCQFGNESTRAVLIDTKRLTCQTPLTYPHVANLSIVSSAGDSWCCETFYFYPDISMLSVHPLAINKAGGDILTITVDNLPKDVNMYCLFGSEFVKSFIVNFNTISCISPTVLADSFSFGIGTNQDIMSNLVQISTFDTSTRGFLSPRHGIVEGGTNVTVRVSSPILFSKPACVFGTVFMPGFKLDNFTISCLSPATNPGLVEVYVSDLLQTSDLIYVSRYLFELPPVVLHTNPYVIQFNTTTDVMIQGSNFVDSSDLSCFVGGISQKATWLSGNVVMCTCIVTNIHDDYDVSVSNNGMDMSNSVKISLQMDREIFSVIPTRGFVTGMTPVTIQFQYPSKETLFCRFGGKVVGAYNIDDHSYFCFAPEHAAGVVDFVIFDQTGPLFTNSYEYVELPIIQVDSSTRVLSDLEYSFNASGVNLRSDIEYRIRSNNTNNQVGSCRVTSANALQCSVVAANTDYMLFVDATCNSGKDYLSNLLAVPVIPPIRVVSISPAFVYSQGGATLEIKVASVHKGFPSSCKFKADEMVLFSSIKLIDETTLLCQTPDLPIQSNKIFLYIEQDGYEVSPAIGIVVLPNPIIASIHPEVLQTGIATSLYVNFTYSMSENKLSCRLGPYVSEFMWLSRMHGFCTFVPLQEGNYTMGLISTDFPDSNILSSTKVSVVEPHTALTANVSHVLTYAPTSVKFTSQECNIPENTICVIAPGQYVDSVFTSSCYIECIVPPIVASESILLQLCLDDECFSVFGSELLQVLQPISVVGFQPTMGPVIGNTKVNVFGYGFENDATMKCSFGNGFETQAFFVTTENIICATPSHPPGEVDFSIIRHNMVVSISYATFTFVPLVPILNVNTNQVSATGGTEILVTMLNVSKSETYECRFEDLYAVASFVNDTTLLCTSPELEYQYVDFAIGSNRVDLTYTSKLQVVSASKVIFLDPTNIFVGTTSFEITVYFDNNDIPMPSICMINEVEGEFVPIDMGAQCKFNHNFAQGSHMFTLRSLGAIYFSNPISFTASSKVFKVTPTQGFAQSSTLITLRSLEQLQNDNARQCCFIDGDREYFSAAMVLSDYDVSCQTPIIPFPELYRDIMIGMADMNGNCLTNGFKFRLVTIPAILHVSKFSGPVSGGSTVEIVFADVLEAASIYCRIGENSYQGQIVGGNNVICITRPQDAGIYKIEFSVNGKDFISSGYNYEYLAFQAIESVDWVPEVKPIIYFIEPTHVPAGRSQIVRVRGEHLRSGSQCVIGNSFAIETRYISEGELECVVPVHAPGIEGLYVLDRTGIRSEEVEILFSISPSLDSITNAGMTYPSFGPKDGMTVITVFGHHLSSMGTDIMCLVGDDWSFAFELTDYSVKCMARPSTFSGMVDVKLANKNREFLPGTATFEYIEDPLIFDAQPARGSVLTELRVLGRGFSRLPSLTCVLGDVEIKTTLLSDTIVICSVPDMTPGTYSVALQTNGQHYVTSGVEFEYFAQTKLHSLWPLNGPSVRGNTVVSIHGQGFPRTVDVSCIFGDVQVPAVVLSDELLQCRSPSHFPGRVNVSVFADGALLHPANETLEFVFVPDVSVDKITPEFGYTSGGYIVFVFGSNFQNTSSLGCAFADMKSRGIFLSPTAILCLAPSPLGRSELKNYSNVAVEVTNNGFDYSESKILFNYSEPCDRGFFCPGMGRQLCPNGTYCPVNSRNFTLCPPGYFQPREGQADCVSCPIGYICPDLGMSRPIICPAGQICDVMGLRASKKSCPMGFYCLNGTKASTFTSYQYQHDSYYRKKTNWITDPVSYVVYFNSTSYNWDFKKWASPAVGQSRALHPPENQCDGRECFPGSLNVLAEAPFPCPLGYYCRTGVGTEIPIPKNFSTPQRCFDGFFCPRGSYSPEGQGPCPNGYFCPTQMDAIICPRGHYCPGVGNRAPIECYPGTYNPFEGRANCTVCPTGHICPGWGTLLPETCPAGFVCMALGLSYPVVLCPQGYYCKEGTLTTDPSDPTPLKPYPCPKGVFCLGGVYSITTLDWIPSQTYGATHAQLCSEGTYCQSGAYLSSGSGLCFLGHYCPPNTTFPIQTPIGNFASSLGSVAPTLCYPGTYAPLLSQIDCLKCPSGHTCQSYGTYKPSICPVGTYRSQVDSVTCTPCPTGTYSYEVGATDLSLCLPCPVGRVCGNQKMISLNSSTSCPAGYVCGYGTDRSRQFAHKAPAGYHTPINTRPENQYDWYCPPGYYCPRGTSSALQFRAKCTVGYYCPRATPSGSGPDVKCPKLTNSLSGSSIIEQCRINEIDVCDKYLIEQFIPMQDITYYPKFEYTLLDGTRTNLTYDSNLAAPNPTGEIQVSDKIMPINVTSSSPFWQNDTIEAFRACPQYGSQDGGDRIIVIGRNFKDSKANYCKFRACVSANLGRHPRRCKNQIVSPTKQDLSIGGIMSEATYISRAHYISPTRMECLVPEFLFDDVFEPNLEDNYYYCGYTTATGELSPDNTGNFSYIRQCESSISCMNLPEKGQEYFTSLTFPCTAMEIYEGICAHKPEPNYMFNPCMSTEVAVEVTNDGEHYSGGVEINGTTIQSTVQYDNPYVKIYRNFKNFTVPSTFAVYTYVKREFFYDNPEIMVMERSYCSLPRYSEEGYREREAGWFQLQAHEAAHVHVDLTHIPSDMVYNQHYKLAIFVQPSRCTVELCSSTRVRLSPEEFLPCRNPMKMTAWFEDDSIPKNIKNNITVYALDDLIFKIEVHIMYGLFTAYAPLFKNTTIVRIASPSRVKAFTGLGMSKYAARQLSQYISFEERWIPMQYIFCAVFYKSSTQDVSQPLNMPPTYQAYERGRALLMYNVSADSTATTHIDDYVTVNAGTQFWDMPASTNDESKEMLDAYFETFHETTYDPINGYSFAFENMLIPYLPFFSNCHTFDSYIPIWLLLEGKECKLPDIYPKDWYRYKFPPLPDQDSIKFVGPFQFMENPVADWCERTLTCHYEEDLANPDNTPRWFEAPTGTGLFDIIREPIDYGNYTGRTKGIHVQTTDGGGAVGISYFQALTMDNFISVGYDHTMGDLVSGCTTLCFGRSYLFTILYYQVDPYTKRIVSLSLVGDQYDFDLENREYELQISYQALGWFDLIMNFAYDILIFAFIFIILGLLTIFVTLIGWFICRVATHLQNPPELRIISMFSLVVPPPAAGVSLAILPIWFMTSMGNYLVNGFFYTDPNLPSTSPLGAQELDAYALTYGALGSTILTSDMEDARNGRIGTVFVVVGFCCFVSASKMYFPKEETKRELDIARRRLDLASKEELWKPILWKKANLIFSSMVMGMFLVLLVEFSYWGSFGDYIWQIIVIMTIIGNVLEGVFEHQVQDAILVAPLSSGWSFATQLVTFGSPDFLSFLLSYFIGVGVGMLERVFLDDYVDQIASLVGFLFDKGVKLVIWLIPKYLHKNLGIKAEEAKVETEEEADFKKREVDGVMDSGDNSESVEPIIGYFNGICSDTMILFYFPYFVYLLMQFRIPIGLPERYGIRQSDMLIYLVFQLVLIAFVPFADILNHSQMELYHGYKLYEYLVYSRYRFLQRECRWKGMEDSLDECIEESMRKLDQMCFSSQYYLMLTLQVNGIIYIILAFECWLQVNYSPFSDAGLPLLAMYLICFYVVLEFVAFHGAVNLKLWKIKHENTDWHLNHTAEDELDIPGWEDIKGASHDAYLMNQRITSETFRYKFLNYNRTWLINQLPQLLTPRTLRRSRPYLINQFARIINARKDHISDDSDVDQKNFGPVALTASSRNVIRWWLGKARRRLRLKHIIDPLIRRARGAECEQCLSRKQLQIEYEVSIDDMADMYDKTYPGDEEVDQVQWKSFWMNNQRYHTICLACLTKRKEVAARNALKGAFDSVLLDDTQEDYPDWGPVYLTAASKAILLNWYRKAQRIRQGKRGMRRREKIVKEVSDDEGEAAPEWAKSGVNISESTTAIAIRWLRTARARIQKKNGKGASLREADVEETPIDTTFRSGKRSKMSKK